MATLLTKICYLCLFLRFLYQIYNNLTQFRVMCMNVALVGDISKL